MSFLLCSFLKPQPTTYHSNRRRCLIMISNWIGHVYFICSNFCNLLYWWCALNSAHAASSEPPTFPRRSTRMFSDCWTSTSKLLTSPFGYLISSKKEEELCACKWLYDNLSVTWIWMDYSRHSFLVDWWWRYPKFFSVFDSDLVQQRDSWGHLAEAQHDPSRYGNATLNRPKLHTYQCPRRIFWSKF